LVEMHLLVLREKHTADVTGVHLADCDLSSRGYD